MVTPLEPERIRRLLLRYLTQGGTLVEFPVSGSAASEAVTLPRTEPNANYGVLATPNFASFVWVTNKTTTSFDLNFSPNSPAGSDGRVDIVVFRQDS